MRPLRRLLVPLAALAALACAAPAASAHRAYVPDAGDGTVTVFDTASGTGLATIPLGGEPDDVAVSPDGAVAWVANANGTVSAIDAATNQPLAAPLAVGAKPLGIAAAPDGTRVYVTNSGDDTVSVIDAAKRAVLGAPIAVGHEPDGIAVSPDGRFAYVAQRGGDISVIETATETVVGSIPDSLGPSRVAIGPRGGRGFVTNTGSSSVTAFNPVSRTAVGAPIPLSAAPAGISISPGGQFAYAASPEAGTLTAIDTGLDAVSGGPIAGFPGARGLALTPAGTGGYVPDGGGSAVTVVDAVHNMAAGQVAVGAAPLAAAVSPDQPPQAGFFVPPGRKLVKHRVTFRAGASSDPDGKIADYAWDFGDGSHVHGAKTTRAHRYRKPGTYTVTLVVTDDEGCSTAPVYTGQTAYCNGSAVAGASQTVLVGDGRSPGLRLAGGRRQRVRGGVNLFAECPRKPCGLRVHGYVVAWFGHGPHRRWSVHRTSAREASLPRATWEWVGLSLPRPARRAALRAIRRGGMAKMKVVAVAGDGEGDRVKKLRTVKLAWPRRH